MRSGRVEAFSDGVIAILITIMVLELPKPHEPTWAALRADVPVLLAYVLSFAYLGVYWNNHHNLFQVVSRVGGGVLWANLHLLFWLSLVPFATGWMSEQEFQTVPVIAYGCLMLLSGAAYYLLLRALLRSEPAGGPLSVAVGADVKGKVSVVLYAVGLLAALLHPVIALVMYAAVAVMWIVPDRRMERLVSVAPEE